MWPLQTPSYLKPIDRRTIPARFIKVPPVTPEGTRSAGAKTLCPVKKCWSNIASATQFCGQKHSCPVPSSTANHRLEWIRTSEPKTIDAEKDLCNSTWNNCRGKRWHPLDPCLVHDAVAVLGGSENRWGFLPIKSQLEVTIRGFLVRSRAPCTGKGSLAPNSRRCQFMPYT